jgi:hypothetical protein
MGHGVLLRKCEGIGTRRRAKQAAEKFVVAGRSGPQRLKPDLINQNTYGLMLAAARQPVPFNQRFHGLEAVPFKLLGILRAVFCEPGFVSMEKRNGVLNIFISRPVVIAHHVVLYQVFELGPILKIHTFRLPEFHGCATQN